MSFDLETLYGLLPAEIRNRDSEQGGPLRALLAVIAEQVAVLEEDLEQLYDDQFIETCAPWVVPYIGDLLGVRGLSELQDADLDPAVRQALSQRAQVANTIAYRRRKGTAAVLEQLARDVTGWPARAVEFFQLLGTTQNLNHLRLQAPYNVDVRHARQLADLNTPFDSLAHSVEVRRVGSQRGKYNIPHVGIYLWRLRPYSLTDSPAVSVDGQRYLFSPLGAPVQLFTRPETEAQIEHLAEPINVPLPIRRCQLGPENLEHYYGRGKSLSVAVGGLEVPHTRILVCDLSDAGTVWRTMPEGDWVAVDPTLGRLAFGTAPDSDVRVTYHYGFSSDLGGGEYERGDSLDQELEPLIAVSMPGKIQDALDQVTSGGTVEVSDSGRYPETLSIQAGAGARIELRAANGARPTIVLGGEMAVGGGGEAQVTLNGLLISGGTLRIGGGIGKLRLAHCTLVPGLSLSAGGEPENPQAPSLIVESASTEVEIDHCIVGGLRVADGAGLELAEGARVRIANSIVDATHPGELAYVAPDGFGPGSPLSLENCTVIGRVYTAVLAYACNCIFLAQAALNGTWSRPVRAQRLQEGCVRHCYLPWAALVPRRYRCQPGRAEDANRIQVQFGSTRYGDPAYCQLGPGCPVEIRQGADDEAEMGAFHNLYQPQREANLRARLDEYLRFGLEAGIFYAS